MKQKKICIKLRSDASIYNLQIKGCNTFYCKTVTKKNDVICLCSSDCHLEIFASSNNTKRYAIINTNTNCVFLDLLFNNSRSSKVKVYRFKLLDKNYGLKIDGALIFKQ